MKIYVGICMIVTVLLLEATAFAQSSDTGYISRVFVSSNGALAIQLSNGFANANAANECTTDTVFAGIISPTPAITAAILSAKASGAEVTIVTNGCINNDLWISILSAYLNQ